MSTIRIIYYTHLDLDLQEVCEVLKIQMKRIKTVTVTGNVLNVFMVNGSLFRYEFDPPRYIDNQNPTVCVESLSRLYDV